MKKELLLLVLFFVIVALGFTTIAQSVTRMFVSNINSITANYFPEGDNADSVKE